MNLQFFAGDPADPNSIDPFRATFNIMKNFLRHALAISSLCASLLGWTGCTYLTPSVNTDAKRSRVTTLEQPDPDDPVVGSEPLEWNDTEYEDFAAEVGRLTKKGDFGTLEKMAVDLRESKGLFVRGGAWKIHSLYQAIARPEIEDRTRWDKLIKLLGEWKKAMPQSITPRVALMNAHLGFAWFARGTGSGQNVSPIAWPIFQQQVDLAESELSEASKLNQRCHGYYEAVLRIAKANGWARDRFEAAYSEAIAYDQTYQYFYLNKADYLMPRWHGKPGEVKKYIESLTSSLGEKDGLKMYYLIVAEMHRIAWEQDFFASNGFSWRQTKRGFILYETDHGMSRYRLNEFAQMTLTARDSRAACSTFNRLLGENDFDQEIWGTRENFEGNKKTALNVMCKIPKIQDQAE